MKFRRSAEKPRSSGRARGKFSQLEPQAKEAMTRAQSISLWKIASRAGIRVTPSCLKRLDASWLTPIDTDGQFDGARRHAVILTVAQLVLGDMGSRASVRFYPVKHTCQFSLT